MPYIEPNSDLMLLKDVPLDPTYENTLWFLNVYEDTPEEAMRTARNAQISYFTNKMAYSLNHLSYTRRGRGYIRAQISISQAYECSYMMYKNTEFENKWFFAFIKKVEYVNNITTDIYFEIDLLQTWYFDYYFHQCFIERAHAPNGTGYELTPESFELGDYVVNDNYIFRTTPVIVMATTEFVDLDQDITYNVEGRVYPGRLASPTIHPGQYYSGVYYYTFDPSVAADIDRLNAVLEKLADVNKIDAIISIFMGAKEVFAPTEDARFPTTFSMSAGTTLDGYTVRNKKLLYYPFNFMQVSNFMGEKTDLRFELGGGNNFHFYGNETTRPGITVFPVNYRGLPEDFENAITCEAFPLCSYNNDTYKAWLAQNQGAWASMLTNSLLNAGLSLSTPINPAGATPGGGALGSIATLTNWLGQAYDHFTLPQTNHGNGNGDLVYQAGFAGFGFYRLSIMAYMAEKIDDFFDMYGYAVNKVGLPIRMSRPCYTYVKTIGCNIEGNLPAEDKKAIEAIYDKGVRYWRTTAWFGNYDSNANPNGW